MGHSQQKMMKITHLFCLLVIQTCSAQNRYFTRNPAAGVGGSPPNQNPIITKSAFCDDNYIYFSIQFARIFRGVIYTDRYFDDQSCKHVDGSIAPNTRYNVSIPLHRCGTEIAFDGSRRNTIIVQRDPRILESYDNKFILTCNSVLGTADQQNGQFTVTLGGITVEGTLANQQEVTNAVPLLSNIDYSVEVQRGTGPFGARVSGPISVGEPISYVVKLRSKSGQDFAGDARIGRCWATDSVSDIQLADDNGCSVQPNEANVWNQFQSTDSLGARLLYNNIKTWAFPTSNRVNIFCNLHFCNGVCGPRACTASFGGSTGINRSPREVEDDAMVRLEGSFEVLPKLPLSDSLIAGEERRGGIVTAPQPSVEEEDDVCLGRGQFAGALSALLIFAFISVAAAVGLCYMKCNRSDGKGMRDPSLYPPSTMSQVYQYPDSYLRRGSPDTAVTDPSTIPRTHGPVIVSKHERSAKINHH